MAESLIRERKIIWERASGKIAPVGRTTEFGGPGKVSHRQPFEAALGFRGFSAPVRAAKHALKISS